MSEKRAAIARFLREVKDFNKTTAITPTQYDDLAPFPEPLPYDILMMIISFFANDKKKLGELSRVSRDFHYEANKYLWAKVSVWGNTPLEFVLRAEDRVSSRPKTALHIRELVVNIPTKAAVPTTNLTQAALDWTPDGVTQMISALETTLSCAKNVRVLHLQADGHFAEVSQALSRWAWKESEPTVTAAVLSNDQGDRSLLASSIDSPRYPNRLTHLKGLETNLYAADGLLGFLAAHDSIENLKLDWRRDRWYNETGDLMYTSQDDSTKQADSAEELNKDSSASIHEARQSRPVLPNIHRIVAYPRGLPELTRARPIEHIETTIRDADGVRELINAMVVTSKPVTWLKVVAFSYEVLEELMRGLTNVHYVSSSAVHDDPAHESTSNTGTNDINEGVGIGRHLRTLVITSQAPTNVASQEANHIRTILSWLRTPNVFGELHTLRWRGTSAPPTAVQAAHEYAPENLRLVEIFEVGRLALRIVKADSDSDLDMTSKPAPDVVIDGRGKLWARFKEPAPRPDGSRFREIMARHGAPVIRDHRVPIVPGSSY
ncbi:hypothetical protein DL93DRAFT_2090500 [Clavulina sp. PMI_390]|nr:hypothetical protein DL93DRAFT_2090500 [Clavulina sp. PMI_390]